MNENTNNSNERKLKANFQQPAPKIYQKLSNCGQYQIIERVETYIFHRNYWDAISQNFERKSKHEGNRTNENKTQS